jgi:hypothetical protein
MHTGEAVDKSYRGTGVPACLLLRSKQLQFTRFNTVIKILLIFDHYRVLAYALACAEHCQNIFKSLLTTFEMAC